MFEVAANEVRLVPIDLGQRLPGEVSVVGLPVDLQVRLLDFAAIQSVGPQLVIDDRPDHALVRCVGLHSNSINLNGSCVQRQTNRPHQSRLHVSVRPGRRRRRSS